AVAVLDGEPVLIARDDGMAAADDVLLLLADRLGRAQHHLAILVAAQHNASILKRYLAGLVRASMGVEVGHGRVLPGSGNAWWEVFAAYARRTAPSSFYL